MFKTLSIPALAALVATPALAAETPVIVKAQPLEVRSERVSYASLDLGTARGQKALRFRVAGAIERVCDKDVGRDGLQDRGYEACEAFAWNGADPQIERAIARAGAVALGGGGSITVTAR